jgi:hypothetical protein
MDGPVGAQVEAFNPWSIVHLVFHHLAAQGLHPVLGQTGDPAVGAAQLLRSLGIRPALEGDGRVSREVREHLAQLREAAFDAAPQPPGAGRPG